MKQTQAIGYCETSGHWNQHPQSDKCKNWKQEWPIKPINPKLLSINADAKTVKGTKKGHLTGIVYLAPAKTSGVINVCTNATKGCMDSCLYTAGRASIFPMINEARVNRTLFLHGDRTGFLEQLAKEISALVRKANRENLIPCVRCNGTSDLPWLAHAMAERFPNVQFYDYTKHPRPYERVRSNYHLTFSHSEINLSDCLDALSHGINVAVVFDTKRGKTLPKTWQGYQVTDGDISDLRFTDAKGVVIGLRAKGRAKRDCTGFVERTTLVSIAPAR